MYEGEAAQPEGRPGWGGRPFSPQNLDAVLPQPGGPRSPYLLVRGWLLLVPLVLLNSHGGTQACARRQRGGAHKRPVGFSRLGARLRAGRGAKPRSFLLLRAPSGGSSGKGASPPVRFRPAQTRLTRDQDRWPGSARAQWLMSVVGDNSLQHFTVNSMQL